MSNYLCPECGCDRFVVTSQVTALYHLEVTERHGRKYIGRGDEIDTTDDEVEVVHCAECSKEIDYGTQDEENEAA